MTDHNDQHGSEDLATGEAGADQDAWEGADIDTEQLISSDQTSSGSASATPSTTPSANSGTGTEDADTEEVEATEEAVEEPAPSTELDAPLTEPSGGGDADGSTDHQPDSGPAAEETGDARGIYDTAPD